MSDTYEFTIAGALSQDLLRSFHPSEVRHHESTTVFVCPIVDDGELFGVIGRCETLRLRLVGLRKVTVSPSTE